MVSNSSSSISFNLFECFDDRVIVEVNIAFLALKAILCLPVSVLVLYLGHQRWRQKQRSFKTTSHSDIFTYHLASMNLIWVLCCICYIYGLYTGIQKMIEVGMYATTFLFSGEMLFHVLTCVERYLAVVHPVTYRGLKDARGVRIRNVSIGCVWLLIFGMTGVMILRMPNFPFIEFFCILFISLIVVSFCSLSVLCILIRPGPGDRGRQKEYVDQSKQRAFHTMTAILGVLWFWFIGVLVAFGLNSLNLLGQSESCILMIWANWSNLPSTLVLPLLYLHRVGKLSCC